MENYYTEVYLNNLVLLQIFGFAFLVVVIPCTLFAIIRFFTTPRIKHKGEKPRMTLTQKTASLMPTKREFTMQLAEAPQVADVAFNTRTGEYASIEDFENEPGNLISIPKDMGKLISSNIHNDYFVLYTFGNGLAMVGYDTNEQQQVACIHKQVIEDDGYEHAIHLLEEEMEYRTSWLYETII